MEAAGGAAVEPDERGQVPGARRILLLRELPEWDMQDATQEHRRDLLNDGSN